jgi:hypothetical protein
MKRSSRYIPEPTDLAGNATTTQKRIWDKRVDEYVKRDIKLNENLEDKFYTLMYGQCMDLMRAKF